MTDLLPPFAESTGDARALGFDPERLARIGSWMQGYVDAGKLPYALTAVARHGEIAFLGGAGSIDPEAGDGPPPVDHLARIYSMTKPVVTAAALSLYEEGRFQLDDPIAHVLPEFAEPRVYVSGGVADMETTPAETPITVRHLMTHTAGLTYGLFDPGPIGAAYRKHDVNFGDRSASLEAMTRRAASVPLLAEPGTRWVYSVATDVLGRYVEVVAGKPLGAVLEERVLAPLGMVDTAFGVSEEKAPRLAAMYEKTSSGTMKRVDEGGAASRWAGEPVMQSGGGGLVSTLPDYLRFTEMLRRNGALGEARLLGRKTVDLMMSNFLPGDIASIGQATFAEMPMVGLGFGLGGSVLLDPARAQIVGTPGEFAWGGVASTAFWIDREERLSVVFLTQLTPSSSWPIRRELRVLTYQALVD